MNRYFNTKRTLATACLILALAVIFPAYGAAGCLSSHALAKSASKSYAAKDIINKPYPSRPLS